MRLPARLQVVMARPELLLALTLGLAASLALAVYKFASEVVEGDTAALDRTLLIALRHGTEGGGAVRDTLRAVMFDLTALGDPTTLTLVVALAAGYLLAVHRPVLAAMLVVEVVAGTLLVRGLKMLVGRERPDIVTHLAQFSGESFPSGHAADSAIIYLSLAILVARVAPTRAARRYVVLLAGSLTLGIGLSRLYLGVHWPSDVLAGWAIGSGWALIVALLAQWMRLRRRV